MDRKWIVVTGASSGIGYATTTKLIKEGYAVVATSKDKDKLNSIFNLEIEKGNVITVPWDLSDIDSLKTYSKEVNGRVGKISGLVHCAGNQKILPVHMINKDKLLEVFNINTFAAICLASAFAKKNMYVPSKTSFIFISSISAHSGVTGNTIYASSKGAIEGFVTGSAAEFAKRGIRINSVAPGRVRTPMVENFMETLPEEARKLSMDEYPLGWGEPEDVASIIEFLLNDRSRWLTGQNYIIDGGHLSRDSH